MSNLSINKNVVTITKLAYSKMDTASLLRRYYNPKQVDNLSLIIELLTKRGKFPEININDVEIKQSDIDFNEIISIANSVIEIVENVSVETELPIIIVTKKVSKKNENSSVETIKFLKLDVNEYNGFIIDEFVTFTNKVTRYGIEKGTPIVAKILYFRQKAINGKLYAKLQYEENNSIVVMMKVLNSISKIDTK